MAANLCRFIGLAVLIVLAAGCGSDKGGSNQGGSNDAREEAAFSFHLAAHGFGPLNSSQDACLKFLREIAKDGKPPDAKTFKQHIEDYEKAVAERKERLKHMDPRPEGKSVQPLLESCEKHVELQEKLWLPTLKELYEKMEKGADDDSIKTSNRDLMPKCQKAEKESRKELEEKFHAYEKEFEPELKKRGRI